MKILLLSLICYVVQGSSFPEAKMPDVLNEGGLQFDHVRYDAVNIPRGRPISHDFVCTNTSDKLLLITMVRDGCSCTNSGWTKSPIRPGEKGIVTATYNASSPGRHTFSFTVNSSDTEKVAILTLSATVVDSIR